MKTRLTQTMAILAVFFLLLNVAASMVGGMQAPNPTLKGFTQDCDGHLQPCWYGIVPGITTADEQILQMQESGYILVQNTEFVASYKGIFGSSQYCQRVIFLRSRDPSDALIVREIILSRCPDMQSGHVMSAFRQPYILSNKAPMMLYDNGAILAVFTQSSHWKQSSFEPVEDLRLRANSNLKLYRWHGFLIPWRYCQIEPHVPGCDIG